MTDQFANWRQYQSKLKKDAARRKFLESVRKNSVLLFFLCFAGCGIILALNVFTHLRDQADNQDFSKYDLSRSGPLISKEEIRALLNGKSFLNLQDDSFNLKLDDRSLLVETCLDVPTQTFVLDKMDRNNSRYIGVVLLDPTTGKVLTMASYDKENPSNNLCLDSNHPAASLFKIITAAAAVETCGFMAHTKLSYNGGKHTLYKSQLKNKKNRYTQKITLRDSFAQSVNPVFGKIGTQYLKKPVLEEYAEAFGFNREIDFEIPLSPSFVNITTDPYQWAEIASGFNRETRISPLHGALIASAIANHGILLEPSIIDRILDANGDRLYESCAIRLNQVIKSRTTQVLKDLMRTTIRSGTCRKAFKGFQNDPILSRLDIGGKTGSIGDKTGDLRYDWFLGYAEEKQGPETIAVSVVVAHEEYIGIRASQYARMAIQQYFRNYFAQDKKRIAES
ncbi:penicillin-binding transpeptidase domain-containing protein [Thermodesulfobacteriota bacterium]